MRELITGVISFSFGANRAGRGARPGVDIAGEFCRRAVVGRVVGLKEKP
jgi:hypothetical protein